MVRGSGGCQPPFPPPQRCLRASLRTAPAAARPPPVPASRRFHGAWATCNLTCSPTRIQNPSSYCTGMGGTGGACSSSSDPPSRCPKACAGHAAQGRARGTLRQLVAGTPHQPPQGGTSAKHWLALVRIDPRPRLMHQQAMGSWWCGRRRRIQAGLPQQEHSRATELHEHHHSQRGKGAADPDHQGGGRRPCHWSAENSFQQVRSITPRL